MKLQTHYIFSMGLLTLLGTLLTRDFGFSLFFSSITAVLGNAIIDKAGHEIRGGFIRRTPLTHTLPRSAVWGSLPAIGLSVLSYYLYGHLSSEVLTLVLISPLNGLSHMFLDAFTEKGIYIKRNGKWERFALAHFSYDNPAVNGLMIVVGIMMIFLAVHLESYHY